MRAEVVGVKPDYRPCVFPFEKRQFHLDVVPEGYWHLDGPDLAPPAAPGKNGIISTMLAGEMISEIPFNKTVHAWARARLRFAISQQVDATNVTNKTTDIATRMADFYAARTGYTRAELLPAPKGGATDNFNRADSTNLGASWTEVSGNVQIVSNEINMDGASQTSFAAGTSARFETDFTVNHRVTVDAVQIVEFGLNEGSWVGAVANFASAAESYYVYLVQDKGTPEVSRLLKCTTGTFSDLVASGTQTKSLPDEIRLDVDTASQTGFFNATSDLSDTDTTHDANVRGGFFIGTRDSSNSSGRLDNFEIVDIGGGGPTAAPVRRNFLSMGVGR